MPQLSPKIERYLVLAARLLLGGIFLYAGMPKIIHPAAFATTVYHYQLLPDVLINLFALILPWVEVLIGTLLIAGIWLPGAIMVANLLLVMFIVALSITVARGLDIDCGCFATAQKELITFITILRDLFFIGISGYLFFATFFRRGKSTDVCDPAKS